MRVITRNDHGHITEAELTPAEAAASEWFNDHLDTEPGTWGHHDCAKAALATIPARDLDLRFVDYLSDGTLALRGGKVVTSDWWRTEQERAAERGDQP